MRIPFVVCEVRKQSLSLTCWRAEVSMLLSEVAVGFLVDLAGRCASEEKEIRIMLMSSSNADCWKNEKGSERDQFPFWSHGSCGQ